MGFLDKAKGLADQAMAKADEAMTSATDGRFTKQRMPTSATWGSSPTSRPWAGRRRTSTSSASAV